MKDLFQQATKSRFGLRGDSDIFFVDDDNQDVLSVKQYLNRISSLSGEYYSIMGSDNCDAKMKMVEKIVPRILSFIHPRSVKLGAADEGCILAPGAVLAPRAVLGKHVLCNYNSVVGYESVVGDYSVIGPNASVGNNCTLGKGVYVGSNACIRENISIGDGAIIEIGAIITEDIPSITQGKV
jgi:acetyltransferase-like isoleucine patch superfamily enzyme